MITDSNTWRDYVTPSVLIALAGCALFFFGTFLDIGKISAFGYTVPISLAQLNLSREVMMSRIFSLAGAAVLFLPKLSRPLYAGCGLAQYVLFAPKVIYALRHLSSAGNLIQALGLDDYIRIEDYFSYSFGYYLLLAGALIILGCSVYFVVSMRNDPEKSE